MGVKSGSAQGRDGVFKQPIALMDRVAIDFRAGIADRVRPITREYISLGMGHEAQDSASAVREASRVFNAAIGVFGEVGG